MRKIYVTLFAFSLSYMSFGQGLGKEYNFGAKPKITSPKTTPSEVVEGKKKPVSVVSEKAFNVLWNEDFGTATTDTTTNGVWVENAAPDSTYWSIGQTHPFSAFGWSDQLTGSFLRWDSYNPIDAVETSFASTSVSGAIVSPNIDLSAAANGVMLSFKTEAMYCCHATEIPFKISISQDGGTTWSNPITLDFGVDRNVATEDVAQPLNYTLDISSYTSSLSPNTKIKFIWDGLNKDNNQQANSHYFWLIDDIQIYERPDYDFQLVDMWLNDIIADYEYTSIPQNFAGTLTVQAKVRNLGKLIPSNTQLALTVTGTGVNATQTGGVLLNNFTGAYDTITFASTIDMSAYAVGSYSVNAKLVSGQTDADTTNNKYMRTFKITNGIYGQADFEQPLYKTSIGKDFGATSTESIAMGFGSVFYIPTDADLHGLNLKIGKSTAYPTTVGGELYVQLYLYDMTASTFNDAHVYSAGDWTFPITSTMVPTSNTGATSIKDVTLNFHSANAGIPTLLADNYYIAIVRHDGGANNHFCYVENPFDDDNSTHIFGGFASAPGDNWFTAGTQIITELNFDNSLSTNEIKNDVTFGFISPNPTSGETTIVYSLKNSQDATIEVMDLTGKCVYSITEKALSTGTHFTNFDASKLSSGVYCVNIKTANSISSQKFVKK
jgi:hypothetical protein